MSPGTGPGGEAPELAGSATETSARTEEGNVETNEAFETLLSQLRQVNAHGQSRRSGADDNHIKIHRFSFHAIPRVIS